MYSTWNLCELCAQSVELCMNCMDRGKGELINLGQPVSSEMTRDLIEPRLHYHIKSSSL